MAAVMLPVVNALQYFTNAGVILAGGKINTYLAGTTTPTATYTDNGLGTEQANPIVLDANGRLTSPVWGLDSISYKFIVTTSGGTQVGPTFDNVQGTLVSSTITQDTHNAAYEFVLADAGKAMYHDETSARTWTIPANGSVAFGVGTVIVLDNTGNSGGTPGAITLAITTDTLRRGDGTAGTGSRTIPANAVCAIRKTKTTEWVITGFFS